MTRRLTTRPAAVCLLAFAAGTLMCLGGCGGSDGPQRYRVSGQVTWQGKPVPAGLVTFTPDVRKGNTGPQGVARIEEGRFDTRGRDGRGVSGGPQIIAVLGYDGAAPTEMAPLGRPLFAQYETEQELPAEDSTLDLVVPNQTPAARP